jgi:hypothetical protein
MRTLVMFVTVGGLAGLAAAQPAPADPVPAESPAQALFTQGRNLLEAGQPGPACERFEASLKLEPEASGTILNLGLCNEGQDRLATALTWFRRVQARASELDKRDTEAAAKAKMIELAAKVPTIRVAFTHPAPAGTTVTIDGAVVREIDYARIELDAGKHTIDVSVPHKPAHHEDVVLIDSVPTLVTIPIAAPVPPPPPTMVVDRGGAERQRAYILGGVGGAVLIGDLVFCIVAKRHHDATDMLDTRAEWQNAVRYGGTALFLAGGTAVAGAAYLYLRAPKRERVEVAPTVGPEHVGVSISGKF